MIRYLIIMLLLSVGTKAQYRAVQLANENIKLNSTSRPGGINNTCITVNIPKEALRVVITLSASNTSNTADIALAAQITALLAGYYNALPAALNNISTRVEAPSLPGPIDFMISDDKICPLLFRNGRNCSKSVYRENTTGGSWDLGSSDNYPLYLCFRNNAAISAAYVRIEIVGIMRD